jgi:hypothetical protein
MARYFTIMQGLRGCYLPDSCNVIRCDTRRELKSALQWEADSIRDAGFAGMDKRSIAWAAAKAWRDAAPGGRGAGAILPYGNRQLGRPYSVEISPSTRADYLEQEQF